MSALPELSKLTEEQLAELQAAIPKELAEREAQRRAALKSEILQVAAGKGLSESDLLALLGGGRKGKPAKKAGKLPAKYRDPDSGKTWSGRGKQPVWLREAVAAGKQVEDFAVSGAA